MLYDVIGNDCYCDDVCPKVFMAGELTWVMPDSTESCIITILTFNKLKRDIFKLHLSISPQLAGTPILSTLSSRAMEV